MARRARLQPDGVGGEHRLVHQDAGAFEGKTDCRCCSQVFAAGGRGELSLVDPALAGNERDEDAALRVECVGAQLLPGRQGGSGKQLLEPSLHGRSP